MQQCEATAVARQSRHTRGPPLRIEVPCCHATLPGQAVSRASRHPIASACFKSTGLQKHTLRVTNPRLPSKAHLHHDQAGPQVSRAIRREGPPGKGWHHNDTGGTEVTCSPPLAAGRCPVEFSDCILGISRGSDAAINKVLGWVLGALHLLLHAALRPSAASGVLRLSPSL